MCDQGQGTLNFVLSLREIATWSEPDKPMVGDEKIFAAIPALQRGLVWKPKQIELLWDSLLRGIPVGSFVVCQKLETQMKSGQKAADRVTHHLLDGQQRANAIFLGFAPFPPDAPEAAILWIDLDPRFDGNSTRNFLVRLTTLAHPWGYTRSDEEGRLSTGEIRKAIDGRTARLRPFELKPYQANVPIPLAILMNAVTEDGEADFWDHVVTALAGHTQHWAIATRAYLEQARANAMDKVHEHLSTLYAGVRRANSARIIALEAPAELLEASQMEAQPTADGKPAENITNIEHLFQRLNQQGTRLDGEELAYSMIKAYWPEMGDDIERCAAGRMPPARMAMLAIRCVLSDGTKELHAPVNISFIRRLSKESGAEQRNKIISFAKNELEPICHRVDAWLGVLDAEGKTRPSWGLLKVHRTGIAIQSPEVYLLLLWLAWKHPETDAGQFPHITGLATLMSWFGTDYRKLANALFQQTQAGGTFAVEGIAQALAENATLYRPILHPDDVLRLLDLPSVENVQLHPELLAQWDWAVLHGNIRRMFHDEYDERQIRKIEEWWPTLWAIVEMKHAGSQLLLYAQRAYLSARFPDYDPARRDLWEAHNRPWDFDHILPNSFIYYKQGEFRPVCGKWIGLAGNMRAVSFEENRSDQAEQASCKIKTDTDCENSFLTREMLCGFGQDHSVRNRAECALAFITACRDRIVAIYREWYTALRIDALVSPDVCKR